MNDTLLVGGFWLLIITGSVFMERALRAHTPWPQVAIRRISADWPGALISLLLLLPFYRMHKYSFRVFTLTHLAFQATITAAMLLIAVVAGSNNESPVVGAWFWWWFCMLMAMEILGINDLVRNCWNGRPLTIEEQCAREIDNVEHER